MGAALARRAAPEEETKEDPLEGTSNGTPKNKNKKTPSGEDVMISYSHNDDKIMERLKERLDKEKLTYWVDMEGLNPGTNFVRKIGQAILESKTFVPLLSESYNQSKYCKDELALAYLSSKTIIGVGIQTRAELEDVIDTGIRLQMARQDWFDVGDNLDACLDRVLERIKQAIAESGNENPPSHGDAGASEEEEEEKGNQEFWEKHFANQSKVPWENFLAAYETEFGQEMVKTFGGNIREKVIASIHRELDVEQNGGEVIKGTYKYFCKREGNFWITLRRQVAEDLATDEVLGMSSSVRVDFIEYLGKLHNSKRIVEALLDLLDRGETDSQVTAAISLARIGESSERVIGKLIKCLESGDRLVRQSGCLALGHLKAKEAVPMLIKLWRNDVIADVRQATEISLQRIGGEEAMKAIEVTQVLSNEIRELTQENEKETGKKS